MGRAYHQELRTGRRAERVTRSLERDEVEQPPASGLERVSRFDRELRAAIEKTAAALRELRDEIQRLARWMREQVADRPQSQELSPARQAVRDAALRANRDRGGPSR